ncbi:MAG TPA: protein phosphatase 2C domain-containing protein [Vicinamibacterales bacterium]|nr:protein phosphatase 2C domain-containing protein [Vicinamibacterales bacterium]
MKTDATGLLRVNGLRAAAATDCGRMRDHNEDTYHLDLARGVFLVVDGVGGAAAGEVAAGIAADLIRRRMERQDAPADVRVREAITLANREILLSAESRPDYAGMSCVLTLALLEGQELTIGHVGDSRLYRLDARGISKLTHDHSPIGELEDARTISETEAMLDDRRNEVYRDVGSEHRDPEAGDFIELVRTRFDDDAAILICSDGLTDMLPALEVNRIVRQHAGSPQLAVAALIDAANEAGGKDNVTALIVEGAKFRRTPDGGRAFPPAPVESQVPTLPLADRLTAADAHVGSVPILGATTPGQLSASSASSTAARGGGLGRMMRSRGLALVGGVLLGVLVPMGIEHLQDHPVFRTATRELLVGGGDPAYATIAEALKDAKPGDVVSVEPGEYSEAVDLPEGVELRASKAGKVVLVAPPGSSNWTAITAGAPNAVVRGVRIAGSTASPVSRGVAVSAANVIIDDVTFDGTIGVGVAVEGDGAVVRSSRFDRLAGTAIRLTHDGASLRQNVFRAANGAAPAAVEAVGTATATLDANVFEHFAHVVEPMTRAEDLIGQNNFVIPAEAPAPGRPEGRPLRGATAGRSEGRPLRNALDAARGTGSR